MLKHMCPRRKRAAALNHHSFGQFAQRSGVWNAFNLRPVGSWMLKARIGKAVLQPAIISQQHQALAVMIETARGIDTPDRNVLAQSFSPARELTEYAVRFVENNIAKRQSSA